MSDYTLHHNFLPHNESRGYILDPRATGVADCGAITQLDFISDLAMSCKFDDAPFVSGVTISKELVSGVISVGSNPVLAFTALKRDWVHGKTLFLEGLADGYMGWVTPGRVNLVESETPVSYTFSGVSQSRIAERCLFRRGNSFGPMQVEGVKLSGTPTISSGNGLILKVEPATNDEDYHHVYFRLTDDAIKNCTNGKNYIERYQEEQMSAVGRFGGALAGEFGNLCVTLEGPFILAPIKNEEGVSVGAHIGISVEVDDACGFTEEKPEEDGTDAEVPDVDCSNELPPNLVGVPSEYELVQPGDEADLVEVETGDIAASVRISGTEVVDTDETNAGVRVKLSVPAYRKIGGVITETDLEDLIGLKMLLAEEEMSVTGWTAVGYSTSKKYVTSLTWYVVKEEVAQTLPLTLLGKEGEVYLESRVVVPPLGDPEDYTPLGTPVQVEKYYAGVVNAQFDYSVVPINANVVGSKFSVQYGTAVLREPLVLLKDDGVSVWQFNTTPLPARRIYENTLGNWITAGAQYDCVDGATWTFGTSFTYEMSPRLISGSGANKPASIVLEVNAASTFKVFKKDDNFVLKAV